jgi:ribosomal protein S18 acetylase RimI-like enzyme
VAWDGDEVVGTVLSFIDDVENKTFNRKRGYTEDICVRRPWRRKGIARALLVQSMKELKSRGMTEAALGVDTENPSGALRLYLGVGYHREQCQIVYHKPIEL